MAFNSTTLSVNPRNRVRLLIGDIAELPWLDDGAYNFVIDKNEGNELRAAYDLLGYIQSRIALEPVQSTNGYANETRPLLEGIEARRKELEVMIRKEEGTYAIPIVVRSDRKDWKDIDSIKF